MKKKILFLCSNMRIGGFQKSLVSLLQYFDYEKYDVDLLLFRPEGVFMSLIPEQVKIIPPPIIPDYLESTKEALPILLKKHKIGLLLWRAFSGCMSAINKGVGAWLLSRAIPKLHGKHYDIVIDYNGQWQLYYMVDKIDGIKKYSYFHSDYAKWKYYLYTDRIYYQKVDAIVTVSDDCMLSMQKLFPRQKGKIYCIENIIADKTVNIYPIGSNNFQDDFSGKRLVTVGRVCSDKGLDYALEACRILKEQGERFRWYWIGPYTDLSLLKERTATLNINEEFVFLGATDNPYDYMRNAYLLIHPSKFEGKAVAVEESKVLAIPVVATNYSTVSNQIVDGENGSIVEMNADALAKKIKYYLQHPELREKQHAYMLRNCTGNAKEIDKLYELIED